MEKRINALLLKFPGTNCDEETGRALRAVGFETRILPFALFESGDLLKTDLLVLPGGFSYGDYIMAGRLAQLELQSRLGDALFDFRDRGGCILGICNGFQILMRLGLLPRGSLIANTSGRFQCRWVALENQRPDNLFLRSLPPAFELPIAHAEGRFVTTEADLAHYLEEGLITLTYRDDVNGSMGRIAGIQDASGQVFGLMPHPERFLVRADHYDRDWSGDPQWGWGYYFFRSIYDEIALMPDAMLLS